MSGRWTERACALVVLLCVVAAPGCTRRFWRLQADDQTYDLVAEKAVGPGWNLPLQRIYREPGSRLFDPTNPDHPAMPPDDPTSHQLMHWVDGMRGYPCWHQNGDIPFVDAQTWRRCLNLDADGRAQLDRHAVVALAYKNSRDYQTEVEDLYLSALDVTFERFRFQAKFFLTNDTLFTADGPRRPGGGGESSSLLRTDTNFSFEQTTAVGGEIVGGLANSIIWQFSGDNSETAFTILDFAFVQPLLRFGGRARVMEQLTQSERTLLANVRQLELFRQGFYNAIITGRDSGDGPARAGVIGNAGLGVTGSGGTGTVGGFYGILQVEQQLRNLRFNVLGLRDSLAQLTELYEAGRIANPLQVEQARQALYNTQSNLLTITAGYESRLDAYKIQLGLPPDLEVAINDKFLDRFRLIDDSINNLQDEVGNLLDIVRAQRGEIDPAVIQEVLEKSFTFRAPSEEQLEIAVRDYESTLKGIPARREQLETLLNRPELKTGYVDIAPFEPQEVEKRMTRLKHNIVRLADGLDDTWAGMDKLQAEFESLPLDKRRDGLIDQLAMLSSNLLELSLTQAGARLEAVTLAPVDLDPADALEIARVNRLDWMNARAGLVDAWRQIEFQANPLKAGFNILVSGDLQTTDDNPVRFRDTTGRLRVGAQFDTPLTRLIERNNYREAQIAYQRARRQYMLFEDRLNQGLRATIRVLRLNQLNFEMRRAAVIVAVKQVDLARERLREPPKGAAGQIATISPTTARDLVSALSDLNEAQNNFLNQWVNYETLRMSLDFELGTMELDQCGEWLDPGKIDNTRSRANFGCYPYDELPRMLGEPTLADPAAQGEEVPPPREMEENLPAPQGGDDADIPDHLPPGRSAT